MKQRTNLEWYIEALSPPGLQKSGGGTMFKQFRQILGMHSCDSNDLELLRMHSYLVTINLVC
jgi:hypothetical protein